MLSDVGIDAGAATGTCAGVAGGSGLRVGENKAPSLDKADGDSAAAAAGGAAGAGAVGGAVFAGAGSADAAAGVAGASGWAGEAAGREAVSAVSAEPKPSFFLR